MRTITARTPHDSSSTFSRCHFQWILGKSSTNGSSHEGEKEEETKGAAAAAVSRLRSAQAAAIAGEGWDGITATGNNMKLKEAKGAFDASIDSGITFFDTAEVYGGLFMGAVNSESLLGSFIKERQKENLAEIAVATKFAALP